jgi:membrane protein YqaA with SNARE-associated domain
MLENLKRWQENVWAWFCAHARSRHALAWLALVAFADAIFFPIAPEVFLVALVLAHKERARQYLGVAAVSSALGAIAGYFIAAFIFREFGEPILQFYHLEGAFHMARHVIGNHVFWAMAAASFTPVPDKVFIYAGGFLGAPFLPFIAGYALGRTARMALFVYLTEAYGRHVLDIMARYFKWVGAILVTVLAVYGIVRWHLLGL